jgi:hypothetical protein
MNPTDRPNAALVINTITTTGVKVPAVTDAYTRTTTLTTRVRNLAAPADALGVAVANAIEDDRDPSADPEVTRILVSTQIANAGIMGMVDDLAYSRFRQVCAEHADAIVKAWAKPFAAAAKNLTAAHQAIGHVDLADSDTIIRKGGAAVDAWSGAQAAVATINTITAGWLALAMFTHGAPNDQRYPALRLAAVDYQTWEARELERRKVTPWEAVLAGLTLTLPSFEQYAQRVATIEAGQRAATQAPIDGLRSHIAGREIRVGS